MQHMRHPTTMSEATHFDAIIIGAGAAGLFYAAQAGSRGLKTLVLDHARKPAEKVRISGGGRCNFTNIYTEPAAFLTNNPHFAKSALARYTPWDFVALVERHGLSWHEKTLGQLFCDQKSTAIIELLMSEVRAGSGEVRLETPIKQVSHGDQGFRVELEAQTLRAPRLVIATGGLSIPKMGATGFAYDVARQFGHAVVKPTPALVPFTFSGDVKEQFSGLSGVSCPVRARAGSGSFDEAMLFTHRGLSGPAMLQVSSYWDEGEPVSIDLFAGGDGAETLLALKAEQAAKSTTNALASVFPRRLAEYWVQTGLVPDASRFGDIPNAVLEAASRTLSHWTLTPAGT